jgi:RNA polymerase sigma-70 factor (ECF subfamily)
MESTATLLHLIRGGDEAARNRLFRRYLPLLQRWASGRLPSGARDQMDTNDLVQVTLLKALGKIGEFESRHEGALLYYLRRSLLNQIRDQARRVKRRPEPAPVDDNLPDGKPSPLDDALRTEVLDRYDAALEKLTDAQRQAVVLRLEMGFTHAQVADALECPSADAARMLAQRAVVRLAEELGDLADVNGEGTP